MGQREMPIFSAAKPMEWLSPLWIERCVGEGDAILLCWNKRTVKYSLTLAAALLDMPKSHLSNILSGKKYLPNGFRGRFQRLCGNWAIRQWEDMTEGLQTVTESFEQRQIRLLEAKLAKYERAA